MFYIICVQLSFFPLHILRTKGFAWVGRRRMLIVAAVVAMSSTMMMIKMILIIIVLLRYLRV